MTYDPAKRSSTLLRAALPDLLGLIVVALAAWNVTRGIAQTCDIGLGDETAYLWRGATLGANGLPDAANAPLYAVWYRLLAFVCPDRVQLYYLNYKLLTILPALMLYLFLRVRQAPAVVGMCAAVLLVVARGNVDTLPKVGHFSLGLLLGGLALASRARTPTGRAGMFSLAALAAAYARPEYGVAFLMFAGLLVWTTLREHRFQTTLSPCGRGQACPAPRRRLWCGGEGIHGNYRSFALVAALSMALLGLFGFPLGGDSGRGFLAFQQHFSLNWVRWTHSDLDPWTDSDTIVRNCFGDAHSALQCAWREPGLVARHVGFNLAALPGKLFYLFLGGHKLLWLVLGVLALAGFRRANVKACWAQAGPIVVAAGIFTIPPLIGSICIAPRDHYLLMLAVPALAGFLMLVGMRDRTPGRCALPLIVLVGLLFLQQTHVAAEPARELPARRTIEFLAALPVHQEVRLLEDVGGFTQFLPANWSGVAPWQKQEAFDAFARRHGINAILLTGSLTNSPHLRSDAAWQSFLATYPQAGFDRVAVPGTPWQLLIKRDLLDRGQGPINSGSE